MSKTIRLTEADLTRLVKKVIKEQRYGAGWSKQYPDQPISIPITRKIKFYCPKSTPSNNEMGNRIAIALHGLSGQIFAMDEIREQFRELKTFDDFCSVVKNYSQLYNVDMMRDLNISSTNDTDIYQLINNLPLKNDKHPVDYWGGPEPWPGNRK